MALVEKGFGAYWCWGEGLPGEVKDIVTHFVVIHDDQASNSAATFVMYIEYGTTYVVVAMEVEGGSIVACALEITKICSQ